MKPIFSLPFSPYMKESEYQEVYLPFVKKYAHLIYDIYATIKIEPFVRDAMGSSELDSATLIQKALQLQNDTALSVSATFNDIYISPSQENLNLFIKNFTPLYEAGIHSVIGKYRY